MTPFFEPMRGEVTGVTTDLLCERHGPIVARACSDSYQFVVFGGGPVFESYKFSDGTWLPWSTRPCHSEERLARAMGLLLERAE